MLPLHHCQFHLQQMLHQPASQAFWNIKAVLGEREVLGLNCNFSALRWAVGVGTGPRHIGDEVRDKLE
jgi:hypothetical protein